MTDQHNGARRPDEDRELTGGEVIVHDLLLADGAAWRRSVPANNRLNATVRTLTSRALPGTQTRTATTREVTREMPLRPTKRTAIVAAAATAALIASLFGTILYSRAGERPSPFTGQATVTVAPTITAQATTTVIPGPASAYVPGAVTARAIDKHYVPVDVTSHFRVGDTVYVVLFVRGLPRGEKHTLTVQWYLGSVRLDLPGTAQTSVVVDGSKGTNQNAAFALNYPTPGLGRAMIYWDLPPGTSEIWSGQNLAQEVTFIVQ